MVCDTICIAQHDEVNQTTSKNCLFLRGVLLLLTLSVELLLGAGITHDLEGAEGLHLIGDDLSTNQSVGVARNGDDLLVSVLSGGLELSLGGIALARLGVLAGEEDELGLVGLEAVHVGLERLGAAILAAVINGNADGHGKSAGDTGLLELIKGEAAAQAHLVVVTLGGRVDDRAEKTRGRAGEGGGSLLLTVKAAALGASWLVQPGLDQLLPVLLVVPVGQDVVVLNHRGQVLEIKPR